MTVFIRIGLALLFVNELVVGAWNAIWPEGFYRYFPTVDLTPPFSEHYARDFSVPHFFYHLNHTEGMTRGEAIGLTSASAVVALLGIAIILVTSARHRRIARQGTEVTSARPSY